MKFGHKFEVYDIKLDVEKMFGTILFMNLKVVSRKNIFLAFIFINDRNKYLRTSFDNIHHIYLL